MSAFTSHLGLEYIDGSVWMLYYPLVYEVGEEGSGRYIMVPAGFITDFHSIPRGLWNVLPPTQYGKSSVLHDYLYRGGHVDDYLPTRAQADAIYREALGVEGASQFRSTVMYLGVRIGGWAAWQKKA